MTPGALAARQIRSDADSYTWVDLARGTDNVGIRARSRVGPGKSVI